MLGLSEGSLSDKSRSSMRPAISRDCKEDESEEKREWGSWQQRAHNLIELAMKAISDVVIISRRTGLISMINVCVPSCGPSPDITMVHISICGFYQDSKVSESLSSPRPCRSIHWNKPCSNVSLHLGPVSKPLGYELLATIRLIIRCV